MFSTHNLNSNQLSIRNLILLFLTIVFGFASVITLAQISIPTSIQNARQTIAKVSITEDGTDTSTLEVEISSGGIFINEDILDQETNFSGKVLGIDEAGNMIYVLSESLVVSGVSAGGGGSGYWTGNGAHIYNINTGNVGIGTSTMSGKLHIKGDTQTELYLEENNMGSGANINLKNTVNTWMLGGFSDRFYIGLNSTAFLNITTGGRVGIGTTTPKANLHIIGNFIAGSGNNIITGEYSSIIAGTENSIQGNGFIVGGLNNTGMGIASAIVAGTGNQLGGFLSFIGGGQGNSIIGNQHFIGGGSDNTIYSPNTAINSTIVGGYNNTIYSTIEGGKNFIGGGSSNTISGAANYTTIVGGQSNEIIDSNNAFIGGGWSNETNSSLFTFIGGGKNNDILNGAYSSIIGGYNNTIENSLYSVAGGYETTISGYNNTFIWNSSSTTGFSAERKGSFLINVPFDDTIIAGSQKGGVGINTNNPRAPLDVNGIIRTRAEILDTAKCNTNTAGSITFDGTHFYGCDGTDRKQLDN